MSKFEETVHKFDLSFIGQPVTIGAYTKNRLGDPDAFIESSSGILDVFWEDDECWHWNFKGQDSDDTFQFDKEYQTLIFTYLKEDEF